MGGTLSFDGILPLPGLIHELHALKASYSSPGYPIGPKSAERDSPMIAVVQRVLSASVTVEKPAYSACIEGGLLVLLGVATGDDDAAADWMAGKLARLRVFKDEEERMNRSVLDTGGQILLVSQFTLLGNTAKGNRPSFIQAAEPTLGEHLYQQVAEILRQAHGLDVKTGLFGAMMQVQLVNDGPVTLIVNTPPSKLEGGA